MSIMVTAAGTVRESDPAYLIYILIIFREPVVQAFHIRTNTDGED